MRRVAFQIIYISVTRNLDFQSSTIFYKKFSISSKTTATFHFAHCLRAHALPKIFPSYSMYLCSVCTRWCHIQKNVVHNFACLMISSWRKKNMYRKLDARPHKNGWFPLVFFSFFGCMASYLFLFFSLSFLGAQIIHLNIFGMQFMEKNMTRRVFGLLHCCFASLKCADNSFSI